MTPGIARLTEEAAPGGDAALADDLWRLAYLRSRSDVQPAKAYLDVSYAGMLLFFRRMGARAVAVVDVGERLVGAVDAFPEVPVGSAVRLAPASFGDPATWKLVVDERFPLAARVRFDRAPGPKDPKPWLDALRVALEQIRVYEAARRTAIAAKRRALPPPLVDRTPEGLDRVEAIYKTLRFLEHAEAESRSRTAETLRAERLLETLDESPFTIGGIETALDEIAEPAGALAVLRAIALLARAG